jgi:hypothetical protein
MSLDKTQRATLIELVQKALTQEQLEELLPRQEVLLDLGISNLLKTHSVDELTVEMMVGNYEMVTEHVAPAERILLSERLSASADKD